MLYNVRIEDAFYNLNNTILKMGNYDVVDIMSIYDFLGENLFTLTLESHAVPDSANEFYVCFVLYEERETETIGRIEYPFGLNACDIKNNDSIKEKILCRMFALAQEEKI